MEIGLGQGYNPDIEGQRGLLPETVVSSWAGVLMDELKEKLISIPEFCQAVAKEHLSDAAGKPLPKDETFSFNKEDSVFTVNYQVTYKHMQLKVIRSPKNGNEALEISILAGKRLKTRDQAPGNFRYQNQNDSQGTINSIREFIRQI